MKHLLFILFLLICLSDFAQTKSYHEYHPTASDNEVIKWNISKDSIKLVRWYIEETTDKFSRVVELRFLKNGKLRANTLCYLPDIVKYFYPDKKTIIETFYSSNYTPVNSLECEAPYKIIYKLNDNFQIIKARVKFHFDEAEMLKEGFSRKDILVEYNALKKQMKDSSFNESYSKFISYYLKSFSKYNRQFPINVTVKQQEIFSDIDNAEFIDAAKCLKLN